MNKIKRIILWLLVLVILCICGSIVMKIFNLMFSLNYENIIYAGFKVGFGSWLILIIYKLYFKNKK